MSYVLTQTATWPRLAGLGQPAPLLSPGAFGRAMSNVGVPADAVRLLRSSSTFRNMASVLDNAYVDHLTWQALTGRFPALSLTPALRIGPGSSLTGRRILYVGADDAGSLFIRGQSLDSVPGYDVIKIKTSIGANDTIDWIHAVAHESAHAFARVSATTGPGPTTPIGQVQAAVADECNARTIEQRVVAEIRATPDGRRALASDPAPAPVTVCDCESDFFPSAKKRTYLEQFVIGMEWESAARALNDRDRQDVLTKVAAIPHLSPPTSQQRSSLLFDILQGTVPVSSLPGRFPVLNSPAGQAAFALRFVDESWRQMIAWFGGNSKFPALKRLRMLRHAALFFKVQVGYSRCRTRPGISGLAAWSAPSLGSLGQFQPLDPATCPPAGFTAAQARTALLRAIGVALGILKSAASKLDSIEEKRAAGQPRSDEDKRVAKLFVFFFRHDPNVPIPWADNKPSGVNIAHRLRKAADALVKRGIHYRCACPGAPATRRGQAAPGDVFIDLCNAFWNVPAGLHMDAETFRAGVILHETLHLIYDSIDDAGPQRANDHCYEAFAMRAAGHAADPSDVRQCRPDLFP